MGRYTSFYIIDNKKAKDNLYPDLINKATHHKSKDSENITSNYFNHFLDYTILLMQRVNNEQGIKLLEDDLIDILLKTYQEFLPKQTQAS